MSDIQKDLGKKILLDYNKGVSVSKLSQKYELSEKEIHKLLDSLKEDRYLTKELMVRVLLGTLIGFLISISSGDLVLGGLIGLGIILGFHKSFDNS